MDYHASIVAYDIHGFSALCIYSTVLGVFGDFVAVIYVSVTYPGVDFLYKAPGSVQGWEQREKTGEGTVRLILCYKLKLWAHSHLPVEDRSGSFVLLAGRWEWPPSLVHGAPLLAGFVFLQRIDLLAGSRVRPVPPLHPRHGGGRTPRRFRGAAGSGKPAGWQP